MEEQELKELKTFYEIDPEAPYYTTGVTVLDEVVGGGLGIGMPGGKLLNICGDASSGKCILNGYVITNHGFERIEAIGENMPLGATLLGAPTSLALDADKEVQASHFYVEEVTTTVKITTDNCLTLEGTLEHPIGVMKDGKLSMVKLSEISVGNQVALPVGMNKYGSTTSFEWGGKVWALTKDMAHLLGALSFMPVTAYGTERGFEVVTYNPSSRWIGDVFSDLSMQYSVQKDVIYLRRRADVYSVTGDKAKAFLHLWEDSDFSNVPRIVLKAPMEIQEAYLSGRMGVDDLGKGASIHMWHIEEMQLLRFMLLNMGYIAKSWLEGEKIYHVHVLPGGKATDQKLMLDTIVSIELNTGDSRRVYDYHVPDRHLFWANGFINHNTFLAWHTIAANHYFWQAQGVPFKWVYDDTEHGSTLDVDAIYGLADYEDHMINSNSMEEAHSNMNQFITSLEPGERGIYVLDSLDPLKTESDVGAVEKDLEKMAEGKAVNRGSYDMAKQKYLSSRLFPQIVPLFNEKHAILIILSQVRYNVSGMGAKFTVSGGKAADHNFNARVMLSKTRPIQTTIKGETVDIGAGVKAKLMKNKCPRPMRECQFDLYFTRGIDDVGACLDYLYDLKTDTGLSRPGNIEWDGTKFTRDKLVAHIYENRLIKELRNRTINKWEEKEAIAAERAKAKIPEQIWEW